MLEVLNLVEKIVECEGSCSEDDLNEFIHFLPTESAYVYFLLFFNELNAQVQAEENVSIDKLISLINDQVVQEAIATAIATEESLAFDSVVVDEFLPLAEDFIYDRSLYRSHLLDWLKESRKHLNIDLINNLEDVFYDSRTLSIYNGVLNCDAPS